MSMPVSELSNLSLDGRNQAAAEEPRAMIPPSRATGGGQSKRSVAQSRRRQRERAIREENERQQQRAALQSRTILPASILPALRPSPPASPVRGHTGILYDTRQLSPRSRQTAVRGLTSDTFVLGAIKRHEDNHGTYCAFELLKSETVRLRQGFRPECTCDQFKEPDIVMCDHIFNLYDELNRSQLRIPVDRIDAIQRADQLSIEGRFTEIYTQLEEKVDHMADESIWYEDDDEDQTIQQMFAVLNPDHAWDKIDDDMFDNIPKSTSHHFEDLVVPGNLELTMLGLARHDRVFRERLRRALNDDVCVNDFLSKLNKRKNVFLSRFDKYAREGPALDRQFVSGCAGALQDIVGALDDWQSSQSGQPSQTFKRGASEFLLSLLEDIWTRNRDIYERSTWLRGRTGPAEARQRNLFINFVLQDASPDEEATISITGLLATLGIRAWTHLQPRLQNLATELRASEAAESLRQHLNDFVAPNQQYQDRTPTPPRGRGYHGGASPTPPAFWSRGPGQEQQQQQLQSSLDTTQRASSAMRRPPVEDPRAPQRRRVN